MAVYKRAKSGKTEPKHLTKKLMLSKFQIPRERKSIIAICFMFTTNLFLRKS